MGDHILTAVLEQLDLAVWNRSITVEHAVLE